MKRSLFTLIAATCLAIVMLSCTKVGTSTGPGGGANSWTVHGVLRIAGVSEPDNMNPILGNQQIETDLSMFWAGYLFNRSDQNEFVPELATQVPTPENGGISRDGLTVTYHLRKGVKWQDGAPFSADDVIFTWKTITNPRTNVQTRTGYDEHYISRIDEKDPYTIVVHLVKPWAPFVATFFTMSSTAYPIMPKHLLGQLPDINQAAFNTKPVGTGPFIVQEWQKGTIIRMTANPNYWRGAPKLKEVDYQIIPDETTILTKLLSHEADMEFNAPSSQTPSFKGLTGYHIYLTPFTQYRQIGFNLNNPILKDVRVRQALAYAIDQQELIDNVSHGVNMKGDTDQPSFLWAHAADVQQYPHDTAAAAKLLDAAGWTLGRDGYRYKNGQKLEIGMSGATGSAETRDVETIVQREWQQIGVQGDIKNYITPLFFATMQAGGILQSGKFDAGFFSWVNGVDPDDSTLFMCDQFPPNGQNTYHFCNAELDAAERVAVTQYAQDKRKAAYDTIQRILAEQEPMAIVWFVRRQDIVNSDLRNYKPAHAVTTFWNTWEYEL